MNYIYVLFVMFSFSSLLTAMDKPKNGGKAERLAASAGDFAQAARRLREQAEQEQQSGFFDDVDKFISNLFSSHKKTAAPQGSSSDEQDVQKGVEQMNQAFANWKKDPANQELREELSKIQQQLITLQSKLLNDGKPQLMMKLNDEIAKVSQQRNQILASRGQQPKHTLPVRPSAAPAIKPELRITRLDISRALNQLSEKRNKSRMPFVWGTRIGLLGALTGFGYGIYSNSNQSLKVAAGCATLMGVSMIAQSWFPQPTEADAKKFLEQQK